MKDNDTILSSIGITLNGNNTGVSLYHEDKDSSLSVFKAKTLTISNDIILSQADRKAKRHDRRKRKRLKFAKYLAVKILNKVAQRNLNDKEIEAVSYYMNRRGYDYFQGGLDPCLFDRVPNNLIQLFFIDFNPNISSFIDWIFLEVDADHKRREIKEWKGLAWGSILANIHNKKLSQDTDFLKKLELFNTSKQKSRGYSLLRGIELKSSKELIYNLSQSYEKNISSKIKQYEKNYNQIIAQHLNINSNYIEYLNIKGGFLDSLYLYLESYELSVVEGHVPRDRYIKNILHDISLDERFMELHHFINPSDLASIIGHINNLKWKSLHRIISKSNREFNYENFKYEYIRFLKEFRFEKDKHHSSQSLIINDFIRENSLREDSLFIKSLMKIDPILTIPPYERRVNTVIFKDQSLLLCPENLNKNFPDWKSLISDILRLHPYLSHKLEHLTLVDRKNKIELKDKKDCYILHRFLDMKDANCKYKDNIFTNLNTDSFTIQESYESYILSVFNNKSGRLLIEISKRYDYESTSLDQGIWLDSQDNICTISNINPPRVRRVTPIILATLLGETSLLNKDKANEFIKHCWDRDFEGRSSLKNFCKKIYDKRKSNPNVYLYSYDPRAKNPNMSIEDRDIIYLNSKIAKAISMYFCHKYENQNKYNNPYIISKLYKAIEINKSRFSKESRAILIENLWRESYFNISPMHKGMIKPFDNILIKILKKKASVIASLKVKQWGMLSSKDIIEVPIFIEHSKINFEIGLNNGVKSNQNLFKKQKAKSDIIVQDINKEYLELKDVNICPYTGETIGENGELSYILCDQDVPMYYREFIYNTSLNLIYIKTDSKKLYELKKSKSLVDLHPIYLQKVFGSIDINVISSRIKESIFKLSELPKNFYMFDEDSKVMLKHAFFMMQNPIVFDKAIKLLTQSYLENINNTQKFISKCVVNELRNKAHKIGLKCTFKIFNIKTEEIYWHRHALSNSSSQFRRQVPEPISSFSIDAYFANVIGLIRSYKFPNNYNLILKSFPKSMDFISLSSLSKYRREALYGHNGIASTKLYKESLYAEKFLPFWINDSAIFIGFKPKESFIVQSNMISGSDFQEKLYQFIRRYTDRDIPNNLVDYRNNYKNKWSYLTINKSKAFETLHKVATEQCTLENLDDADMLDSLRYTVRKVNIKDILYKRKYDDKFIEKAFNMTFKGQGSCLDMTENKITIPAKEIWNKFFLSPELYQFREMGINNDGDENIVDKIIESFFRGKGKNNINQHIKVRKIYSLPILDKPSGGVRIRRKSSVGSYIYQLQSIEGYSSKGIYLNSRSNAENSYSFAYLDCYLTKNLAPVGYKYKSEVKETIYFDQWFRLRNHKQLLNTVEWIEMSWGSRDRRKFKISQKWDDFINTINLRSPIEPLFISHKLRNITSIFDGKIKIRGAVNINSIGSEVIYTIIADSCHPWFKKSYFKEVLLL
jgi:hypothetical protein